MPPPRTLSGAERIIIRDLAAQHAAEGEAALAAERLETYLGELLSWNQDSNLVSQGDLGRLAGRHVNESLAALPILDRLGPAHLLDLGSGAGFPAMPLKILRPRMRVTMVESRRRKGLFLQRVVQVLGLEETTVLIARGEGLTLEGLPPVDVATARAVASLDRVLSWLAPLVRFGGQAVLFKGSSYERELQAWQAGESPDWAYREVAAIPDRHLNLLVFDRL